MTDRNASTRTPAPVPSRPNMPASYGIAPELNEESIGAWSHAEEALAASRNYWIGTTRPDGRPHVMPVWGAWIDGALYFGSDPDSRRGRNIAAQPYIVAHLESGDDVVILEGRVEALVAGELPEAVIDACAAKYDWRPSAEDGSTWYVLRPSVGFTWLERDFPGTATKWTFGET